MPVSIADIDTLQKYIEGVMERADHHAGQVNEVALTLAGAIVWRKDAKPIRVMAHGADMKNVLWVAIGGRQYAFSYNHAAQTIEMRGDTIQGAVLHSFSNADTASDVVRVFRGL